MEQKELFQRDALDVTLILIGKGKWSEKVLTSIQSGLPKLSAKIEGSRKFLEEGYGQNLKNSDLIWITSRPQSQLQVLKSLENYTGKILIEKPIGLSMKDFDYLKESRHLMMNSLRLSRVWNYSAIWVYLKSALQSNFTHIEIVRGGPNHESTIPLHIDWLPHDLFLLTDLFGGSMLNYKTIRNSIHEERLDAEFQMLDRSVRVKLRVGNLKAGRVAQWKIFCGNKLLMSADFSKNEIMLENGQKLTPSQEQDAICKMILEIPTVSSELVALDIEVQKRFSHDLLGIC